METRVKDMTVGAPLKLIVSFALPLMVGNIFQQLYTVVDTMVVGKALGVDALAALGATDWLSWLCLGMIQGVTQGFGILMAREFGAKRYASLRRVVGTSLTLAVLCGMVLILGTQLAVIPMLTALKTPAEVLPWSALYIRIIFGGIPAVMAFNLLSTILRSLGDGRTPLTAMILASCTNVALDLLFVLAFRWGIAGAAAATVIAQLCSAVFCWTRLRNIAFLKLTGEDRKPDWSLGWRLLGLGWPMAAQNGIIAIGGLIIQSVVNGYGVTFLAGYTATNKMFGLLEMAAISFGYAMITYSGQNLGAGHLERIRRGLTWANATAVAISAGICMAMVFLGKTILSLFLSGDPQEVELAMKTAFRYLMYMSFGLPTLYILHVVRSTVQGMGETVLPMISGIAEFIMRTGCVLILPALIGEDGIFIGEIAAWIGADLILVPSYFVTMAKAKGLSRESRIKSAAPGSDPPHAG